MLTFAQKPKVAQPGTSARSTEAHQTYFGQSHQASSTARSGHDFSRVPVFPHKPVGVGQVDAGPAPEAGPAAEMPPGAPAREAPEPETPVAEEERPAPEPTCTITSRTAVHAPDGTPDTRTTIGACETVGFSIGRAADWTASTGWSGARNGQATFNWAAPERPGTATITATDPATGETCSLDMNVIAPAGVRLRSVAELAYPAGMAGAGMELTIQVRPRNVNFGWIAIREDSGPASRIRGYFAARPAADLRHNATLDFRRIGWNNFLAPDAAGNQQGDTAATVRGTLPQPWSDGTFQWLIPTRYRCVNSTGNGHVFTHVQQRFTIEADGTVIVTKHAASVERTP